MTKDRYLFRGFHKEENGKETIYIDGQAIKGKWVYGYYVHAIGLNLHYIIEYWHEWNAGNSYEVIPETVGQCVGLSDKNGVKIFENDVIRIQNTFYYDGNYQVKYASNRLAFILKSIDKINHVSIDDIGIDYDKMKGIGFEVIGTIFDKEVNDNE